MIASFYKAEVRFDLQPNLRFYQNGSFLDGMFSTYNLISSNFYFWDFF